jgi:hypothetical protein
MTTILIWSSLLPELKCKNCLIVAYRAPVLLGGRTGREEKSPIHVADVMRMRELSLKQRSGDKRSAERQARGGVLTTHDGDVERLVKDEHVKFNLREDVGRDYRPSEER